MATSNDPNPACQNCGGRPAAKVGFQSIEGLLIIHTIRTVKGTFCRDCGLAVKDRMNQRTLKRAWFGIGAIIGMPIIMGANAARASKINKLAPPVRAQA
jgi:hypothetical protein